MGRKSKQEIDSDFCFLLFILGICRVLDCCQGWYDIWESSFAHSSLFSKDGITKYPLKIGAGRNVTMIGVKMNMRVVCQGLPPNEPVLGIFSPYYIAVSEQRESSERFNRASGSLHRGKRALHADHSRSLPTSPTRHNRLHIP